MLGEKEVVSEIAHEETPSKQIKRGGMTPEGRRRLSLAMKKRWAARKNKGA
jgi:hypothetical protein